MEEILKTAVIACPVLVVLVVLVSMFLRAIEKRDTVYLAFIEKLNAQHLEARESQRQAIVDNTTATRELATELRRAK